MYFIYFLIFMFGASIGSFANVCIFRWTEGQSVVREPSHCFSCGHKIAWYDNIPIFSWLMLKGKCRNCGSLISIQYPFIEFICGFTFLSIFYVWGFSFMSALLMFLTWFFVVATVTDIKDRIIPNELILVGIAAMPIFYYFNPEMTPLWLALGLVFPSILLLVVSVIAEQVTGLETVIGGGDIKLLFVVGGLMGPIFSMLILMGGCVCLTIVYFAYFIEDIVYHKQTYIPMMVGFGMMYGLILLMYYLSPNYAYIKGLLFL